MKGINIPINVDEAKARHALGQVYKDTDKLEKETKDLNKTLDKTGKAYTKVGDIVKKITTPALIGMGAAIGAAALAFKDLSEQSDTITTISYNTGVSIDALNQMAVSVKLVGGEMDNLADAVSDFTEKLGEAKFDNTSSWAQAFEKLGVSLDQNVNKTLDQTLDKLAQLVDAGRLADAHFAGVDLFGDAYKYTYERYVNQGTAGLAAMRAQNRQYAISPEITSSFSHLAKTFRLTTTLLQRDVAPYLGTIATFADTFFDNLNTKVLINYNPPTIDDLTTIAKDSLKTGGAFLIKIFAQVKDKIREFKDMIISAGGALIDISLAILKSLSPLAVIASVLQSLSNTVTGLFALVGALPIIKDGVMKNAAQNARRHLAEQAVEHKIESLKSIINDPRNSQVYRDQAKKELEVREIQKMLLSGSPNQPITVHLKNLPDIVSKTLAKNKKDFNPDFDKGFKAGDMAVFKDLGTLIESFNVFLKQEDNKNLADAFLKKEYGNAAGKFMGVVENYNKNNGFYTGSGIDFSAAFLKSSVDTALLVGPAVLSKALGPMTKILKKKLGAKFEAEIAGKMSTEYQEALLGKTKSTLKTETGPYQSVVEHRASTDPNVQALNNVTKTLNTIQKNALKTDLLYKGIITGSMFITPSKADAETTDPTSMIQKWNETLDEFFAEMRGRIKQSNTSIAIKTTPTQKKKQGASQQFIDEQKFWDEPGSEDDYQLTSACAYQDKLTECQRIHHDARRDLLLEFRDFSLNIYQTIAQAQIDHIRKAAEEDKKAEMDRINLLRTTAVRKSELQKKAEADYEKQLEAAKKKEKEMRIASLWFTTLSKIPQVIAGYSAAFAPFGPAAPALISSYSAASIGMMLGSATAQTVAIAKYNYGGIEPGNDYTGDKRLIAVNSGEAILTRKQQSRLLAIANGAIAGAQSQPPIAVNIERFSGSDDDLERLEGMLLELQDRGRI